MIDLSKYQDIDREVQIFFTDGSSVIGKIDSIDDEEESELGEMGISFFTRDGGYLGIGNSEIKQINVL